MTALQMYDRSRDGLLEIADIGLGENGALRVTVRELVGDGCWIGGTPIARMRRLARRALPGAKSSHLVRTFRASRCDYATFIVSPERVR